jgi:hypothetical protein
LLHLRSCAALATLGDRMARVTLVEVLRMVLKDLLLPGILHEVAPPQGYG